jgi:hypothetical protein
VFILASALSAYLLQDRKEKTQTLSTAQVERFFKNNLHEQKGRPLLALSDDSRQEVNTDKRGLFTNHLHLWVVDF